MAKPIGKTPVVEGDDAVNVLKKCRNRLQTKIKNLQKKLEIKEQFYFNVFF